jgi:hypothetical protein
MNETNRSRSARLLRFGFVVAAALLGSAFPARVDAEAMLQFQIGSVDGAYCQGCCATGYCCSAPGGCAQ